MSDFEEFKYNLNHAAKHWASVSEETMKIPHNKLNRSRNNDGEYTCTPYGKWSLSNFDEGLLVEGRLFVHMPTHHRANKEGFVRRSIIAYELYHKAEVPEGMDVHHKDGNPLHDSEENLVLLSHSDHMKLEKNQYWGKRKNDNFTHIKSHGRPRNVPFEECPKPRRKCLLRAVAYGGLFCMAEMPCWRQPK